MAEQVSARENETMLTLSHLIDSFHAHLTVQHKIGQTSAPTLAWYRSALEKLRTAAGRFPAADLRPHHLTACTFSNHFVRVLKALYKWGSDTDVSLVPRDNFRRLVVPKCGQRTRTLTEDETARLLEACTDAFRLVVRMAVWTGARPGELRTWKWGMVNLPDRVVLLTKFKAKDRRGDNKAVRPIPLCTEAVELLAGIRPPCADPADLVFLNCKGKPWTSNAFRCAMRTARAKAKLDGGGERVVLYTARHTFGTTSTRNGVDGRKLADIMGHTRVDMTARYQHLTARDLVDVIDQATRPKQR